MKHKKKGQFDPSLPFIICKTREQFDRIGTSATRSKKRKKSEDIVQVSKDQYYSHHSPTPSFRRTRPQKENIAVPDFDSVQPPPRKRRPEISPNYIKCSIVYPLLHSYQLRQPDLVFLEQLRSAFPSHTFTVDFFTQQLIQLETRCGRDRLENKDYAYRREGYMRDLLWRRQGVFGGDLGWVGAMMFNYWWGERSMYNYPFYRPLWRPRPFQIDNLSAFRPREPETRSLRKSSRVPQHQLMVDLYQELTMAADICSGVAQRQQLKFNHIAASIFHFQNSLPQQFRASIGQKGDVDMRGVCGFLEEVEREVKGQLAQFSKEGSKEEDSKEEDSKEEGSCNDGWEEDVSIANFLANVIQEAHRTKITYEVLFPEQRMVQQQDVILKRQREFADFREIANSRYEELDSTEAVVQKGATKGQKKQQ